MDIPSLPVLPSALKRFNPCLHSIMSGIILLLFICCAMKIPQNLWAAGPLVPAASDDFELGNETAVLDFKDLHKYPKTGMGAIIADLLSDTLTKSTKLKIRTRDKLRIDLKRNHYHFLVSPDLLQSIRIARKLRLKHVVTGTVLNFDYVYKEKKKWLGSRNVDFFVSIQYAVWDVASGQVIVSDRIDDILKKRVVELPDFDSDTVDRSFLENLLYPTVARMAIQINKQF